MMQILATVFIGLEKDRNNNPVTAIGYKRKLILEEAAKLFGGFSAGEVEGGYEGSHGLVTEKSLRIETRIDAKALPQVESFAKKCAQVFNQECVLVNTVSVGGGFISAF